MELVVTLFLFGMMPLIAAFITRRSRSRSQRRYYLAVAILFLPLLLVAVVKTFGETVPVGGANGGSGYGPEVEF